MNNEKTNLDLIRDFMFVLLLCPAGFAAQSGRKKSKRDTRGGYLRNFRQVSSDVKKRIAESTPGPQGSGFDTPQNERPHLSPQQMANLLNGKQR